MYLKEVKLLHSWERHLMLKFPRGLCTYDPTPPTEELGVAAPLWGLGIWRMAFWAPQPDHDMALNFTSDPHFLSWGFLWVFLQHISFQFALLKRQRSRVPKSVFLHVLAAFLLQTWVLNAFSKPLQGSWLVIPTKHWAILSALLMLCFFPTSELASVSAVLNLYLYKCRKTYPEALTLEC